MDKQVASTPPPPIPGNGGGGGSGYLYLHYWPHVDWEPAINVDMVNSISAYVCFIHRTMVESSVESVHLLRLD